ncbi:PREDICTED: olfactory receptor 6B1-like [Nanorana parkeri]|uniref:olfactory receptor 6B1-like n=1 Tax=Nanorana parkeri TaxID=125878 RepID=UPI0008540008|nr:PREDICTED: olfactory receptor 6B1-like [Nanorana parkeri]
MKTFQGNNISVFILVGFPTRPELQPVLFTIFLITYILTVAEHVIIILTVKANVNLHKPMYYLMCSLSFLEIWYVTVTVPNLLNNFLTQNNKISFIACMVQLYIFISLACTECVLLAVMAIDRCIAICFPLRYTVIMNHTFCIQLAIGSWVLGFSIAMVKAFLIFRLHFCGPNVINHFFCDISPVLNLACTDMSFTELMDFILAMVIIMIPLVVIIIIYICILWTVLIIPNNVGRQKAFSTCASHLTIVIIFYTTTLFIYARPRKANPFNRNKLVTILYSILTPLINPIIYCLRNREVQHAIRKSITKYIVRGSSAAS